MQRYCTIHIDNYDDNASLSTDLDDSFARLNVSTTVASLGTSQSNNFETSQDIDGSNVNLQGSATRLFVKGQIEDNDNYYSFTLSTGEHASLVLTTQNGGDVDLELSDPSRIALARGVEGAINISEHISGFVAP
ncbi:MAG: hypothetical protein WBA41_34135, partial [Rivularia sp. (in: cyanobacteria)]